MKRYINLVGSLLLILSAVSPLSARTLTPVEALGRCTGNISPMAAPARAINRAELQETIPDSLGNPGIYSFATSDGFLLVSADDRALPLLAYGTGEFPAYDDMPPALKEWIDGYAAQLAHVAELPEQNPLHPRKNTPAAPLQSISPLVTARWDQGNPYNAKCPDYSATAKCVTGCVATAMAQVMYTHKYPAKGTGTLSHSDQINGNPYTWTVDFGATTYEWGKMTDTYSSSSPAESIEAVATLMQHLGVALKMDYGYMNSNQSGTQTFNTAVAPKEHFGYSPTMRLVQRSYYSEDSWRDLLNGELAAGRPIIYDGRSSAGGHCFVCDGYDATTDFFHFNWGWSGMGNGYYSLDALEPDFTQGIGGGDYKFTENQMAIIGIAPARENEKAIPSIIVNGSITTDRVYYGKTEPIVVKAVNANPAAFVNYTPCYGKQNYNITLELTDTATDKVYMATGSPVTMETEQGFAKYYVYLKDLKIPEGDYIGRPVVQQYENGEAVSDWVPVVMPEKAVSTVNIHVGHNGNSAYNEASTTALLTITDISLPEKITVPGNFDIKATVKCSYGSFMGMLTMKHEIPGIASDLCAVELDMRPGQTKELTFPCSITGSLPSSVAGNLSTSLAIMSKNSEIYYSAPIPVVETKIDLNFTPTDWVDRISAYEGSSLSGKISTTSSLYRGPLNCQLVDDEGNIVASAKEALNISLEGDAEENVCFSFDPLRGGQYHYLFTWNKGSFTYPETLTVAESTFEVAFAEEPTFISNPLETILTATLTQIDGDPYEGPIRATIIDRGGKERDYTDVKASLTPESKQTLVFTISLTNVPVGENSILFSIPSNHQPIGERIPITIPDLIASAPSLTTQGTSIVLEGDNLTVSGVTVGEQVEIYTPAGLMISSTIAANSTVAINCEGLTPGIYIVRAGTFTQKIVKSF